MYLNTLAIRKKLVDSAPILRVPLSTFDVLRFLEEAPKFPENFLSFFQLFLEGFQCLIFMAYCERATAVFFPPDILGGLGSCRQVDLFFCPPICRRSLLLSLVLEGFSEGLLRSR